MQPLGEQIKQILNPWCGKLAISRTTITPMATMVVIIIMMLVLLLTVILLTQSMSPTMMMMGAG